MRSALASSSGLFGSMTDPFAEIGTGLGGRGDDFELVTLSPYCVSEIEVHLPA